jgi:PAN domain
MNMFRMLLFALGLIAAAPVGAVDGVNLPGRDYAHFPAPSAGSCRRSCGGDERCQAYTWVKPGIQGPQGMCWLKSSEPPIVKDPCCDSAPRRYIEPRDMVLEDKIDRPGSDYKNFTTAWTKGWEECRQACDGESACRSWTYVRKGVQGPQGRCWLKNRVAPPVSDDNTVSGVKYRRPSQRID